MPSSSVGDLARTLVSQYSTTRTKENLFRLARELSSGESHDPVSRMSGNSAPLAKVDRQITILNAYDQAAAMVNLSVSGMTGALDRIQGRVGQVNNQALVMSSDASSTQLTLLATESEQAFLSVVEALNSRVGSISLFSGTGSSDSVRNGQGVLDKLESEISGMTSRSDIEGAIESYFGAGGEFVTSDYFGEPENRSPVPISETDSIQMTLRADAPVVRSLLSDLAMIALSGKVETGHSDRLGMARDAAQALSAVQLDLLQEQASLGRHASRIEAVMLRNGVEKDALETWRSKSIDVDPFEAAIDLQSAETHLELVFSVTARLSRLSMVNAL